jgi:hypothetical protein
MCYSKSQKKLTIHGKGMMTFIPVTVIHSIESTTPNSSSSTSRSIGSSPRKPVRMRSWSLVREDLPQLRFLFVLEVRRHDFKVDAFEGLRHAIEPGVTGHQEEGRCTFRNF